MNYNIVTLVGRVTKQPEARMTPNGIKIVSFSLATNFSYTSNGQKKEETDFHYCTAFGKTAETIAQYVVKGQELLVQGRIKYDSWDKKDGSGKAYRTQIIVNTFQFGQKPKGRNYSREL